MGIVNGRRDGKCITVRYGARRTPDALWRAVIELSGEAEQAIGEPYKWRSTAYRNAKRRAIVLAKVQPAPMSIEELEAHLKSILAMSLSCPDGADWGFHPMTPSALEAAKAEILTAARMAVSYINSRIKEAKNGKLISRAS